MFNTSSVKNGMDAFVDMWGDRVSRPMVAQLVKVKQMEDEKKTLIVRIAALIAVVLTTAAVAFLVYKILSNKKKKAEEEDDFDGFLYDDFYDDYDDESYLDLPDLPFCDDEEDDPALHMDAI